ncbi:hypothetical protein BpHYR1_016935 [Brachionus plicatilis]|uniref:Uncharacterized protein n=1 Tax=Brachionus plicatilis TaxID=10195 RepID=A0A3M7SS37_BRAPC|nr:hypothetical protein BpHYR1_016935 [Brachionus plicatilis]
MHSMLEFPTFPYTACTSFRCSPIKGNSLFTLKIGMSYHLATSAGIEIFGSFMNLNLNTIKRPTGLNDIASYHVSGTETTKNPRNSVLKKSLSLIKSILIRTNVCLYYKNVNKNQNSHLKIKNTLKCFFNSNLRYRQKSEFVFDFKNLQKYDSKRIKMSLI